MFPRAVRPIALLSLIAAVTLAEPPPSSFTISAAQAAIRTAGGPHEKGWNLWSNGDVGDYLLLQPAARYRVTVRAFGSHAGNDWPRMAITLDGETLGDAVSVASETPADYTFDLTASAVVHRLAVAFLNDFYEGPGKDRNLFVMSIGVAAPAGSPAPQLADEARWRAAWTAPQIERERERLRAAASAIDKHRKSDAVIRVLGPDDKPVANAQVTAELTRHAFGFGCNIYMFDRFGTPAENELYKNRFADLFNYATTGFYWRAYEPSEGKPDYAYTDRVVAWCGAHDIRLKGHPLLWNVEHGFPRWLKALPSPEQCEARVRDIMQRYRGKITAWEVVNEPAHVPGLTIDAPYRWARDADPQATLIVNDYQVFADGFPPFFDLLKKAHDTSVPFDGIGIQAHEPATMRFPLDRVERTLDHYATLGKPLHITEFSPASGGEPITGSHVTGPWNEAAQAEYAEKFYRICFAHPAVTAITWWDLCDNGAWLNGGGMLHADLSPKPVYVALRRLIREEWHTRIAEQTNSDGQVSFRGFHGRYHVTVKHAGKSVEADVNVNPNDNTLTIRIPE